VAEVLLALGGNIGDVRAAFDRAETELSDERRGDILLLVKSSDYRTPPWGVTDQPFFINRCLLAETMLPPLALLDRVQAVERALGRQRSREQRWGPRTVDIDILSYDDVTLDDPRLTLPHPRLFERAFVLVPLAEIAPDRMIGGVRIKDALAGVDRTGIEKLPPR
jgi:2-amino-4-hydroxy-6-hydroxymethyldihydropteridine diphosphokinase